MARRVGASRNRHEPASPAKRGPVYSLRVPVASTERLDLVSITLPMVEAVLRGDRAGAEELVGAEFPGDWPGEQLIARAFPCSIEAIRADPRKRLWGDTLMVTRDPTPFPPAGPERHDGRRAR
jgi:hypothetical protein